MVTNALTAPRSVTRSSVQLKSRFGQAKKVSEVNSRVKSILFGMKPVPEHVDKEAKVEVAADFNTPDIGLPDRSD